MGNGQIESSSSTFDRDRTHRGDPASGRGSRDGAARLPQSVPEHCEKGSEEREKGFSEEEM